MGENFTARRRQGATGSACHGINKLPSSTSRALITRLCAHFSALTILMLGDGARVLEVPGSLLTREITPEQML